MIQHGQTGYLVRPRDYDGVADAICNVLVDPANARAIGRRARQHVESNFSLDSMVKGYEQIFVRLLERQKGRESFREVGDEASCNSNDRGRRPQERTAPQEKTLDPFLASLTTTASGLG
jgi:hypothetical protein